MKKLVEASRDIGLITKRRIRSDGQETGGLPFGRGHLHQLLANPVYVGDVVHKSAIYPGQHDAIIDRETFDAVRCKLEGNTAARTSATNAKAPSLLTGLVYDETGDRLCPTHANKKGRRYRYYISKRLMHRTGSSSGGWRLSAKTLDCAVVQAVGDFLTDELRIIDAMQLTGTQPRVLQGILGRAAEAANELDDKLPKQRRQLLHQLLHRVILH